MRWFPFCLVLAGALGAQTQVRVISVERRGTPPYEEADRIYGVDGGQDKGLSLGARLVVRRPGEGVRLGHLRVIEVQGKRSATRFEPEGDRFPMKGDVAILAEPWRVPVLKALDPDPIPVAPSPRSSATAPPTEGVLYFLPQRAELSPAGLSKLEAWVQAWGQAGHWVVHVPSSKAWKPDLQRQRAGVLIAALRRLGVADAKLEIHSRTAEGKYDPTWIRHWD